jgi:hypothetical protein
MDFSGVFAALTTPFAADDSVAIADLKQNIQRYNATGLAGYAVQGSTGESVLLSRAEWDSVLVAAKEAASPQKRLLAGTGVESTAETISRTKRAAELGYHAALVKTPYYYKPMYSRMFSLRITGAWRMLHRFRFCFIPCRNLRGFRWKRRKWRCCRSIRTLLGLRKVPGTCSALRR